jgi:SAM-dependent methyltransferase
MDELTIEAYDRAPERYATDWHTQPPPSDVYELLTRYFWAGPTADVGCGAGRDTAWLRAHGFEVVGFDVSQGLVVEARRRYPGIEFYEASLPDLREVADSAFENVLCETVIMHLPVPDIPGAVRRLLAILRAGGTLYLSWRATDGEDRRDEDGRLYSAFSPSLVEDALGDATVLHGSDSLSASSGRRVYRLVVRKPVTPVSDATSLTLLP